MQVERLACTEAEVFRKLQPLGSLAVGLGTLISAAQEYTSSMSSLAVKSAADVTALSSGVKRDSTTGGELGEDLELKLFDRKLQERDTARRVGGGGHGGPEDQQ